MSLSPSFLEFPAATSPHAPAEVRRRPAAALADKGKGKGKAGKREKGKGKRKAEIPEVPDSVIREPVPQKSFGRDDMTAVDGERPVTDRQKRMRREHLSDYAKRSFTRNPAEARPACFISARKRLRAKRMRQCGARSSHA